MKSKNNDNTAFKLVFYSTYGRVFFSLSNLAKSENPSKSRFLFKKTNFQSCLETLRQSILLYSSMIE